LTAPLQFTVFDETIEFRNGLLDASILFTVTAFAAYFVLWKFALRFAFANVFCRFLVYRVVYRLVVLGLLRLAFSFITGIFSWALFFIKLSFCFGCCGLCFRLNKAVGAKPKAASSQAVIKNAKVKSGITDHVVSSGGKSGRPSAEKPKAARAGLKNLPASPRNVHG